jgi:hypothetical protein
MRRRGDAWRAGTYKGELRLYRNGKLQLSMEREASPRAW